MMIVKITIMLSAILFIWTVLLRLYYNANPLDAIAMGVSINRGKLPVWFIIFLLLWVVEVVLIVLSIFWGLFLR